MEKGAHLRRNLRCFPRCSLFESGEHLRRSCAPSNQGVALDPVPLRRKVAHSRVSASTRCFEMKSSDPPAEWAHSCARSIARHRVQGRALGKERAVPLIGHGSAYARFTACGCTVFLWLYRISSFASLLSSIKAPFFKVKSFLARSRKSPERPEIDFVATRARG